MRSRSRREAASPSVGRGRIVIVLAVSCLLIVLFTELTMQSSFIRSMTQISGHAGAVGAGNGDKRRFVQERSDDEQEEEDDDDEQEIRKKKRGRKGLPDVNDEAAPWKLQGKCGSNPLKQKPVMPPPTNFVPTARIAYFLTIQQGDDMVHVRHLLIKVMYDPMNYYIVHMDHRMSALEVEDMRAFLHSCPVPNARLLEPRLTVRWGSFSVTLMILFAMSTALQMGSDWDYFINLSAGDFPMATQTEIRVALGAVKDRGISFMEGSLFDFDAKSEDAKEVPGEYRFNRYVDDETIHDSKPWRRATGPLCDPRRKRENEQPRWREPPTRFQLFWGSHWMVLHRRYVEYLSMSPDNVARSLIAYFSYVPISAEEYFHTVVCHPDAPDDLLVYGDSLRYRHWGELDPDTVKYQYHYHPLGVGGNMSELMEKGALFARTFDPDDGGSREGMRKVEEILKESSSSTLRVQRMMQRMAPTEDVDDKYFWCNASQKLTPLSYYRDAEILFRSQDMSLTAGLGGPLGENEW